MNTKRHAAVLIAGVGLAVALVTPQAQSTQPRVQAANLVYQGSFRVPSGIHSGGQANAGFEYGGTLPWRDKLLVSAYSVVK